MHPEVYPGFLYITTGPEISSPEYTKARGIRSRVPDKDKMTTKDVPRGPVTAEISFVVPPDEPNVRLYNYVDPPSNGSAQRNFIEQPFPISLTDIRGQETQYTLDNAALQILSSIPTSTTYDTYTDDAAVQSTYYPEVEALLLSHIPDAHKVVIFDHTIRRQDGSSRRKPVTRAHVDQTPRAAAERVRLHVPDPAEAETLLKGRCRIINVWRPINGTVVSHPLAFADTGEDSIDPVSGGGGTWCPLSIAIRIVVARSWG